MLLVSYRSGKTLRAGVARDGKLVDAAQLNRQATSVRAILTAGPAAVDALLADAEKALNSGTGTIELSSVSLGPPIPDPDKIICLGLNYKDHAAETGSNSRSRRCSFRNTATR